MTLGTRHKIQQARQLNISIGNTQLNLASLQKLLGVHIGETLSWNQHIDYLCSIISSRISLLRQLSYYIMFLKMFKNVFIKAMLYLLIDYGLSSWGSTTKLNIEKNNKLHKRAAHIIFKVDYITPLVETFQRLRWMTVSQRINYNKAVLTYMA